MTTPPGASPKQLFQEALDLPPPERARFLAGLAAADPAAHDRVVQLLEAHARSASLEEIHVPRPSGPRPSGPPPPATPAPPAAGTRIGSCTLLEPIGSGGSGVVWRARQDTAGRLVALKILRAGRFAGAEERRRFRAEAGIVARLDHPGIVPLYEVGEHEGSPWFTMKLIEGPSLADELERGPFPPRRAAALLARVARAVQHGHDRGVLHRDLKPSNILLDASGRPFVADFGVAKQTDRDQALTRRGALAGTPSYMAPEQFSGKGADATVRIDVHGLGCILFELLAGRPAFVGRTAGEVMQKIWGEPARFRAEEQARIPRDLRTICLRCLEKEPARRYSSAAAVAEELERWLAGEPIRARHVSPLERAWLFARRRPLTAGLAAGVVLLAALLVAGLAAGSLVLRDRTVRAEQAEAEARQRLRASLLATARATRRTVLAGRRYESLRLLRQAAAIEPGPDLRDEAIACLAMPDLRVDATFELPGGRSRTVAIGPRRERAAVALDDGSVRLLRLADGAELSRFELGPERRAWLLVFSPGGRFLALKSHWKSQDERARLLVLDLDSGAPVADLPLAVNGRALAFHPSEAWLAAGTTGGGILLLDARGGAILARAAAGAPAQALCFSPDGRELAVAEEQQVVLRSLPDLASGTTLELPARAFSLDWSPDGGRLAVGCADARARVWEPGSLAPPLALAGAKAEVVEALFLGGGRLLATDSWDGSVRLYDIASGEQLVRAPWRLGQAIGGQLVFEDRDRAGLAAAAYRDVLRVLHGHERKGPSALAVDPSGAWLASGAADGILLWDLARERARPLWSAGEASSLVFHPRTGALYAATSEGLLCWPEPAAGGEPQLLAAGAAKDLSLARDGALLGFRQERTLRVLDLATGDEAPPRTAPAGTSSPSLSPDGALLAAGAWRGNGVRVWAGPGGGTPGLLRRFEAGVGSVSVAFSPDGTGLVSGSPDAFVLRRVADWCTVWTLPRSENTSRLPGSMAFAPGGSLLAVSPDQVRLQLVRAATGEVLATLEAPGADPVTQLCFSPDGRQLLAGTSAHRIQVWRLDVLRERLAALAVGPAPPAW